MKTFPFVAFFSSRPGGAAVALLALALGACSSGAKQEKLLQRAEASFEEEAFDEARIEYMKLLREDPENATAIERIGDTWLEQGAPLRAIPFLSKALELDADNLEARKKLMDALFSQRQIPAAREVALAVLDRAPTDEEAVLILGTTSLSDEDAEETGKRLEACDPETSSSYHLATASLHGRKGELDAAEASVGKALELDPDSVPAYLALVTLAQTRKQADKAREAFEKAAALSGPRSSAKVRYARFLEQSGDAGAAKVVAEELTRQSRDYLPGWTLLAEYTAAEGKHEEALTMLEKVFGRDPANIGGQVVKARILTDQGETGKAVEVYERLAGTYTSTPIFKYNLAQAYLRDGQTMQARASLEETVKVAPEFTDAVVQLARLKLRGGEATEALLDVERLLQRQPGSARAKLFLVEGYQRVGRLGDAEAVCRALVAETPGKSSLHYMLGKILQRQGKVADARAEFETVQELAPDNQAIISELIDLDLAEKDFESALQRVPDTPGQEGSAGYLRGKIYASQGKMGEAEEVLLKALETAPDSMAVYNLLIGIYLKEKKLPEAVQHLQGLLVANPQSLRHRTLLALLHQMLDQQDQAIAEYRKALEINPDHAPALNNLAYLYSERKENLEEAEAMAAKAYAQKPSDSSSADTYGWLLYQKGDYKRALGILEDSGSGAPGNPEIHYHLGMARLMMGLQDSAKNAFEIAANAEKDFSGKEDAGNQLARLEQGESVWEGQTVEELEALLQSQPNDLPARLHLAKRYEREGDPAQSAATYEKILALNPDLPGAHKGLARLYLGGLDAPDKAFQSARKARGLAPGDAEAVSLLGQAALRQGKVSWAYGLLQDASRSSRGNAALQDSLAQAAYRLGKVEEARKAMKQVVALAPGSPESARAEAFLSLTDPDPEDRQALAAAADRQLGEDPDDVPALMVRAALHREEGAPAKAIEAYGRIQQQWPDFPLAQKELAGLYAADSDRLDEARTLAMKARANLPDDPALARTLGVISYHRGEFDNAIRFFDESARKVPLDGEGMFLLGMSCLKVGKVDRGEDLLRKAVETGLDEALATEAEAALQASAASAD